MGNPSNENKLVTHDGRTQSWREWSLELDRTVDALQRYYRRYKTLAIANRAKAHSVVEHNGRKQTWTAWAFELGYSRTTVRDYHRVHGTLPEPRHQTDAPLVAGKPRTLITHDGRTMPVQDWAMELGYSDSAIRHFWAKHGTLPQSKATVGRVSRGPKSTALIRRHGCWERDTEAQDLVAKLGAMSLEEVAIHMGITRERVRQIQNAGLRTIRETYPALAAKLETLDALRDAREVQARGRQRVRVA